MMKDELGGEIMSELCCFKAKSDAYKLDNDVEFKKAKGTKKCVIKKVYYFNIYLDNHFKKTKILKSQYTLKVIIILYIHKSLIRLH